ncbi:LysR family transcriptional regulator [Novosphingobium mangrovi (ex Huang et al. 2023)]|uniref:LysR family transcriptional regulator n=1 Tax=Novosphingobium mangrovi (ex Huang et al. 2023) TaxID=2976432 RepID=A0ABT2I4Z0_9SPHN|nr:LysR family transcriptional regulator [Novosphingobium mangrovi (ex Huang et al. 2023)]MCT2399875.1 LysR family transcriptional regulator [Novosphingobium mangrovi (ex Huang et al. 2023)]
MDISLGKLRQLVTIARCGSFSRAAAELNISQPALSRSVHMIEARYGFPIFNRLGHGVEPTSAGAQVIALAEPLVQGLHVFDSNLKLMGSGRAGQLAIGVTPLLASQLLARFAGAFFDRGSAVQLRAMIRPGEQLLSALRNDEIELFFYPEPHLPAPEEIEIERLGAVDPVCVVRSGHPLAGRRDIAMAELIEFPLASSVEAPGGSTVPSRSHLICDNYHVLRDAVLLSDLVCICSRDFVAAMLAEGALCEISVSGLSLPPTGIYMAKLKGRMISPLALAAKRRMRAYLDGE